jgi:hypothetical protein
VKREERERILRQGVVRPETPPQRRQQAGLEADLDGSPLVGNRLPLRLRNFRPSAEGYLASLGGPLPYMQRLREIELRTAAHERALATARQQLVVRYAGDPAGFARRWRRVAEGWNFYEVNALIAGHNRWYPAESRLPMDPKRGDFALVNGKDYRRAPLDTEWVLERFPADLDVPGAA